jgi:hypothetical protein
MVAPIKREGEKMPPADPDPRLSDVASSLQRNRRKSNAAPSSCPSKIACMVA